jgi:hypothetical protein
LPVVLAATQPVEALVRSVSAIPLLARTIAGSPDHLSEAELANAARPVLDAHYRSQIADFHRNFEQRAGVNRATTDLSDAAQAATSAVSTRCSSISMRWSTVSSMKKRGH